MRTQGQGIGWRSAWLAGALVIALPCQAEISEMPPLRIIGPSAGLPSTDVAGLGQDPAGDVWIATRDGLARYDGIEMTLWQHVPDDPGSLPENRLQTLHVGVDGRIWVGGVSQGAAVLDASRGEFIRYGTERFAQMRSNSVLAIATEANAVWLGTMDGLYRIANDGQFSAWWHDPDDPASLPGRIVINLAFDADGVLWVATTGGLARIENESLQRIALPAQGPSPMVYSVRPEGGRLWVGSAGGLIVRQADGRWQQPEWSARFARPYAVLETVIDPRGGLWLASQRGAWRVSPDGIAVPIPPTMDTAQMTVLGLLLQADGALWVPVYGQGVGYLRSDWRRVTQFARGQFDLAGGRYQAISLAREGGVWLLSRNGTLERMDRHGVVERLDASVLAAFKDDRPVALAVDEAGAFWMGGDDRVLRVDRTGQIGRWRHTHPSAAALPGPNLHITIAPGARVWINNGTTGVQLRDAHSGAVVRNFLVSDETTSGFHLGDLEQMEVGPDGVLWVAGVDGLARLDPERGVEGEAALRGSRVLAFGFDGTHTLWLFRAHQLERFERRNGQWMWTDRVGTAEGLPVIDPGGLRVDAQHRVWLSTPRGLYRWDPDARHMQHVGVQHGLRSQEFIERVLALDADKMLVGATIDGGVVMIDTQLPDPPAYTPRLNLRRIAVRRDGQWQELDAGTGFTFRYDEHEFRIGMRLPDYDAPQSNRYWSHLEGYDQDWMAQGAQGDRIFSGIPPGHYRLHLRASDAIGNSSDVRTLHVHVQPPWWASLGFRVLMWASLAGMLLLIATSYRHHLQRRHRWQLATRERTLAEQSSLAKTRFLATFGHEVRTPMTGVLGMSELLLGTPLDTRQRDYVQSIHNSGQHLLRLVNDALDLARIEANRLELERQPFDLQQMLADVVALQTPLAGARGLAFVHDTSDDVPAWVIGDSGRVRQILLNLLGNAIKFTEHGTVGLRVRTRADGILNFEVFDTGPGLSAHHIERLFRRFEQAEGARTTARYGGSGLGLAISQELAAAMGGRIEVESTPGQGTSFSVALPLPTAIAPVLDTPASTAVSVPSRHLLLVEDDPTVATVIIELLRTQGHTVVHAVHGLSALTEVARASFDLALLDLDLPGVDGLRLARLLREQTFAGPLIAITARSDAEAEPEAWQAGFSAFIRKPLTGQMLANVIGQGTDAWTARHASSSPS